MKFLKHLKRMRWLLLSWLAISLAGLSGVSEARTRHLLNEGGRVGGGGADFPNETKAFFTSDDLNRSVKICAEIGPDFGFSPVYIQQLVQRTFQNWVDYYVNIGGKLRQADDREWNKCSIDGNIRKGYRIATRMEMLRTCDGTEDLTIYFGVENDDINVRRKRYNFPFGFAELVNSVPMHAHQEAWSKGLIWIAKPQSIDPKFKIPSWDNFEGAPLEMLLTHEMGHVFGNQHIDGTIMSADIGQFLATKTDITKRDTRFNQFDPLNLQIDHNHYLVFVPELGFNLPFSPKAVSCAPYDDDCVARNRPIYQMVYKSLTGMDLQSDHFEASFSKKSFDLPVIDPDAKLSLLKLLPSVLSVKADGLNLDLNFTPVSLLNNTPSGQAFQEGCSRDQKFSSNQIGIYGYLQSANTLKKPMVLNVNSGLGRIELIDPEYSGESSFCKFYTEIGMPCVLLSLDFNQVRSQIQSSGF
jgi:hypothetical protein